ncbi:hypothetical protein [Aliiroseovarius sp. S2029]|uniref:hypothetical protein n=1 Tax=Aliiroseovarius sp. S2029 TaxID=2936988 RepID=UPI0020C09408|nr:hypothetical protein [Aliiroseovarius sp. S2029]
MTKIADDPRVKKSRATWGPLDRLRFYAMDEAKQIGCSACGSPFLLRLDKHVPSDQLRGDRWDEWDQILILFTYGIGIFILEQFGEHFLKISFANHHGGSSSVARAVGTGSM